MKETTAPPISQPRSWAEVNLSHLRKNHSFARRSGQTMAILKADAYGHGMLQIATSLESLPAEERPVFIGVASVLEARHLVAAGIKIRLYLLGPSIPGEREEIARRRWTPSISSLAEAQDFSRIITSSNDEPLPVHITVDTGMGRGGFLPEDLRKQSLTLKSLPGLFIEGIGSHLPSADEDREFTEKQFALFDSLVEGLGSNQFHYKHLANSAGLLGYYSRHTNLVRPGLMLYGISPIARYQHHLTPVICLKSSVTLVRDLPKGHGISYGRDTILERDTRVATIGIGYGDGYPRDLSLKGAEVYIHNQRCPVLGRVTMDQIMVDVSALNQCASGDEVELFGENILVTEVAQWAGAIPWSILTGITSRVTRIYC